MNVYKHTGISFFCEVDRDLSSNSPGSTDNKCYWLRGSHERYHLKIVIIYIWYPLPDTSVEGYGMIEPRCKRDV